MTTEREEEPFVRRFWNDPENVKEFQRKEAEIIKDITTQMLGKPFISAEESLARRKRLGIPVYRRETPK
jgi:hypothetical protein